MDTLSVPSPVFGRRDTSIDVKSGDIFIQIPNDEKQIKHKMHMKVFKNGYEHHALLYSDSKHTFMNGFISLRKSTIQVKKGSNHVCIFGGVMYNCRSVVADANCFAFEASSNNEAMEWLASLTPSGNLSCGSEFSPCPSPIMSRKG